MTGGERSPEPRPRAPWGITAAYARGAAVAERGQLWIENQDPASRRGASIGWVRRYQAADGQLYAVLLSAYFFLTVLPVTTVQVRYCEPFSHRRVRLILLPNFLEPGGCPIVFAAVEICRRAALP